ncbi:FtsX-like permease family protein [Kouleothrix sp.]|uniref:FtsX-like permease family protein n=1 Tax=Kouleothrix sp. TaxID=2779161 RepID=UPI00391D3ECF
MLRLQLTLAMRYLWGRKLRTALTTLAIVFGTMVIFGMNILLPTMLAAFQANVLAAAGQVDVTVTEKNGEAFGREVLGRVRAVPGVRALAGSLSRTVNIPAGYYGRAQLGALTLTGIDVDAAQALRTYALKSGRFLRPGDEAATVITANLAESLGLSLGGKLHLPTADGDVALRVVGLMPPRSRPGNEEVLVTLHEAQKLLDLPNRINTVEANFDTTDQAQREATQRAVAAALGDDYTLGGMAGGSELLTSLQTSRVAFSVFGFLALFMGGFIIFNTFRTIIAERRHDIGMLRAIGASRATIVGLILAEGLVQGVAGTLIGMLLGYLMGAGLLILMRSVFRDFLHMAIGGPVVQPQLIGLTLLLGVGVTLLAGLLPALSASRVSPLEALRPPAPAPQGGALGRGTRAGAALLVGSLLGLLSHNARLAGLGGLLFLFGLVLVAPALVRPIATLFSRLLALVVAREGTGELAQSNVVRQPSRAAITASATMVGLAIIVAMGGMIWSLTGGFLGVLQKSLGSDYLIMPPSVGVWRSNLGAKHDLADRLRDAPGVAVVSTLRYAAASANGKSVSLLGIDPESYPKVASLTFQAGEPRSAFGALGRGRALIVNGVFASQAGLAVGDTVRLDTPTGQQPYMVLAVAGDYLNAKLPTAYIAQSNLQRDFRKSEDIFIQLNLAPSANAAAVEPKLKAILKDYPQFRLVSGKSYFEENKQLFNASFAVMYVLLAVLAMPSLIALLNTLAIGVIERTREIGMLRAIGATRRQVRRIVIAEALLLAAIGTAFGLVAGLYLGYVLILGLSTVGYPVQYVFPSAGLVAATAIGLLLGVLAALVPARQAARMNIVRALR